MTPAETVDEAIDHATEQLTAEEHRDFLAELHDILETRMADHEEEYPELYE